ncbi:hypothetical protein, partial [Poseidonibacter sp.]|uniref:hypothetical protein n=1 Tax=Poseidonibacter sp. TaxID=2321188 RepID=UPI003C796AD6
GTTVPAGFVLNSDGTYSFDAKNSTYKSLNLRDIKILEIPVIVTDDKNGTSEAILKINIAGTTNATGYQLSALVLNQDQSTEVNYGFKLSGTTAIDIFKNKVKLADYTQNITYFNSKLTGLEASILKTGELNHDFSNQSTYLSHSDIGNISFSHKLNSILYQGNYTIHSDNLGDFIVGWTNNSWTIDSNTYSYNDLLYSGLKSNSTILDTNKIYTYKGFKGLRVDSDSSNSINNSYFTSQSNTSIILNAKTKSIIASNTETIIESLGSRFSVAKLNDDGTIIAKTYEYKTDSQGIESNLVSDISAQLYGSQAQAIGAYGSIVESTVSNKREGLNSISEGVVATPSSSNKNNQLIETFFIDSNKANTSTGNANFGGLSTLLYSSNNQSNETNNTISFNINRDTGTFSSGNILSYQIENASLFSFDGNVSDLSSYYINDDNFGVKITSYYDTSKKLVDNSSWLVSIPDDIVDGKYVENIDNESSWGYWTSRIEDLETKEISKINAYSTWVAGIQTDVSVVQELIDSTVLKQLNFSGHMIGAVVSGSSFDAIKFDSNNVINLNFNFGAGTNTFSGDYAFKTASGSSLSGNFTNGTASNNGFSLNDEVNTINGKYFGTGEIKSVGGTFNFGSGESNAIGSFKADKK